ncbi:MAG: kelch repeat-containing protein [Chitinophagaceae bacterium]
MKKPFRQNILPLMILLSSSVIIKSGDGKWEIVKTKNPVSNRGECGMAACNGKLYLLGGGALPTEVFDRATLTWSSKAKAPVDINHFQPVSYQNKIYVLEAFTQGQYPEQPNLKSVYIYDTDKDSWSTGGSLPEERSRAAAGAALYNDKLYLVAGIQHGHTSGTTNMFDEYDPVTARWKALPDAPHIRDHCAAAVIKDKLYIAGGRNTSYHEAANFMSFFKKTVLEVDCYDFKTGQWSTLAAKLPLGSGGGSMVNLDDKLYYMGGERATETEPNQPRANVFWLDPSTNEQWKETNSLHEARNGMSAAVINNNIYVFGGAGPKTPPMPDGPRNDTARRQPPPPQGPPPGKEDGPRPPSPLEMFSIK